MVLVKTIIAASIFPTPPLRCSKSRLRWQKAFGACLKLTHVIEPEPTYSACGFTTEEGLMVVGSHGHGVIASGLIGSVAEGMVGKAQIPAPHWE
jgi:hypothetical protein